MTVSSFVVSPLSIASVLIRLHQGTLLFHQHYSPGAMDPCYKQCSHYCLRRILRLWTRCLCRYGSGSHCSDLTGSSKDWDSHRRNVRDCQLRCPCRKPNRRSAGRWKLGIYRTTNLLRRHVRSGKHGHWCCQNCTGRMEAKSQSLMTRLIRRYMQGLEYKITLNMKFV